MRGAFGLTEPLEKDGLIKRKKRTIRFPDWLAMMSVAGFDPLYLHLGQQAAASV
jgi:hypothetical protein